MKKINLTKAIWGIMLSLLLFFYYNHFYSSSIANSAGNMLVFAFGGLRSFKRFEVIQIIAFALIFTTHLMALGNEIQSDYDTMSVYIYTRGKTRVQWLLRSVISIFIKSIVFYIILFVTVLCIAAFMRYSFDLLYIIYAGYYLLLTLVLINTLLIITVNVLCIRFKYSIVYTIVLFLYSGWITIFSLIQNNTLVSLVPISRSILLLHELPSIFSSAKAIVDNELNLSIHSTLLTSILIFMIICSCSLLWFKNIDIIKEN
jgi:hypothetical protein